MGRYITHRAALPLGETGQKVSLNRSVRRISVERPLCEEKKQWEMANRSPECHRTTAEIATKGVKKLGKKRKIWVGSLRGAKISSDNTRAGLREARSDKQGLPRGEGYKTKEEHG